MNIYSCIHTNTFHCTTCVCTCTRRYFLVCSFQCTKCSSCQSAGKITHCIYVYTRKRLTECETPCQYIRITHGWTHVIFSFGIQERNLCVFFFSEKLTLIEKSLMTLNAISLTCKHLQHEFLDGFEVLIYFELL